MNAFLQKRSISTVNEMLHSFNLEMRNSVALSHWPNAVTSQRFCQLEDAMFEKPSKEMKKAYLRIQPRSPLSSLSGSCQGMMRTKFLCCAWSPPQSQSLRMVPVTKTRAFLFFFSLDWRSSLFGEAQRSSTMRGNPSSTLRGGGWKALGTLGRKPLDLK